jgi:HAD superfamily phosphoserine phosphatase-like hydrolase
MNLALFDLDNTLLAGDSDFEWAQFLISRGVLDRELHEAKNSQFYEQYKAGTLDIHEFLDFQLKPLARHTRAELDAWHADFMATRIRPMMTAAAKSLVQKHLEAGDLCAVVTATNSFVTGPIAREFGIPHLIATVPAQEDGRFTGKPRGTPSFREGKIPASRRGWNRWVCAGRASSAAGSTAIRTRRTCETLQEKGFKAYVVGGAVRDLLAGQEPKDFDVATNATPEQVRHVLPPLAHHRPPLPDRACDDGRRDDRGHHLPRPPRPRRQEGADRHRAACCATTSSAARRKTPRAATFTVNALYYDPASETIVDYHHGVADLKQKTLRMIGDPRPATAKTRCACCAPCAWPPSSG